MGLGRDQIDHFVERGFVRIDDAFEETLAQALVERCLSGAGIDPADRSTWPERAVSLGDDTGSDAVEALNSPVLQSAYDQLAGASGWRRPTSMAGLLARAPNAAPAGRWHVDVNWQADGLADDPYTWRVNVQSERFALLLLVNLTEVGPDDGPTRLRAGSHLHLAKRLSAFGEAGVTLNTLAADGFPESMDVEVALTTGKAGSVYVCHPFMVHSVAQHRGTRLRVAANPVLEPARRLRLGDGCESYSPVEKAIRIGLSLNTPAAARPPTA